MKITAIMGSPHKGNGYKIVQKIEAAIKAIDEVDFQYIFLSDIDFRICKGCFACISKGESFCPLKDDRERVEQEILSSDGIILSSPGYAMNVSALMKNFIDRFAYNLHRPKFFKQPVLLVANGGSGVGSTIKALSITLGGSRTVSKLAITATPWEPNPKYVQKVDQDIKKGAKKLYDSMVNTRQKPPDILNLIWFHMFKKMAAISKETLPADYAYYAEREKFFLRNGCESGKSLHSQLYCQYRYLVFEKTSSIQMMQPLDKAGIFT